MTTTAGTFAQNTPEPGPSWHRVNGAGALCAAAIAPGAEHIETGVLPLFKVCPACQAVHERRLAAAKRFDDLTSSLGAGRPFNTKES